jgi:hypothetical protein
VLRFCRYFSSTLIADMMMTSAFIQFALTLEATPNA